MYNANQLTHRLLTHACLIFIHPIHVCHDACQVQTLFCLRPSSKIVYLPSNAQGTGCLFVLKHALFSPLLVFLADDLWDGAGEPSVEYQYLLRLANPPPTCMSTMYDHQALSTSCRSARA